MRVRMLLALFLASLALTVETSCKAENETEETVADTEVNPNLTENMSWTFLTHKLFHNRATVSAGGPSAENPNEGHWMDFSEDGTYTYGVWSEQTSNGTWTYEDNVNGKILELKPADTTKPSQWKVMHKDNNVILVGTSRYGDNAIQQQWVRRDARPVKSPPAASPQ